MSAGNKTTKSLKRYRRDFFPIFFFATILKTKTSDSVSALLGERSTKCLLYSEMVLPNTEDTTSSLYSMKDRHHRNAKDQKEMHFVFELASKTSIADLSLSALHNMWNQIHTSHQNWTLSFHFSLFS